MRIQRLTSVGLELLLTLLVLVFLVWQFDHLKGVEGSDSTMTGESGATDHPAFALGDGHRYQNDLWRVTTPFSDTAISPYLPTFCDTHAEQLSSPVAKALCPSIRRESSVLATPAEMPTWPLAFDNAYSDIQKSIAGGIAEDLARLSRDALSRAEGILPEERAADAAKLLVRVENYRAYYRIDSSAPQGTGSQVLSCAWHFVQGRHAALAKDADAGREDVARQAIALIGNAAAILDGKPARIAKDLDALAETPMTWSQGMAVSERSHCEPLGTPSAVLKQAAKIVDDARKSVSNADRAEAMILWMQWAPAFLAAWVAIALILLNTARRSELPSRFVPLALMIWAVTGWATRVPAPETFFPILGGTALLLFFASIFLRLERWSLFSPSPKQLPLAPTVFPLFVFFVGIGTWMVFDLSANGHVKNRFLAYSQMTNVFVALALLSVLPSLRHGLANALPRLTALFLNALRAGSSLALRLRPWLLAAIFCLGLLLIAYVLRNWRQFTSELFRVWLIFGVASLFLVRNTLWGANQLSMRGLVRSLLPLLGLATVIFVALLITDDMGPLLVILYSSGIFGGAMMAQSVLIRSGKLPISVLAGIGTSLLVCALITGALFGAAKLPFGAAARVAERIESAHQPFTALNDQMAHVAWFRSHTPSEGYGLGGVPWCGTLPSEGCHGLPAQTQSDYTLTALHGIFGQPLSMALVLAYVLWLVNIARRHAMATDGLLNPNQPAHTEEAWIAWLAVTWVTLTIAQTIVTICGNLGWLPLTGVTWPFVSFGLWSLAINSAFLALFINRPELQS